jgi:ABC-type phosphate/phosphonate transport system substrate-binding protein
MDRPVRVGAVMYDPKVSVIWEIIGDFFKAQRSPIEMSFYSTYSLQVAALADGTIDIAWNSPLAWLESLRRVPNGCRAIAMRDTDRDRVSYLVVREDDGVRSVADLRDRGIATGASDSPQATLIPLDHLRQQGLRPQIDLAVHRFDVLVGKHGDHVGGELEAFRSLERRDVAACAMLDLNWETWTRDGTIDPRTFRVLAQTQRFDHCVFTVREDFDPASERSWLDALFAMRYDIPEHREMMDLEGLKAWLPGRTTRFAALAAAVDAERFFEREANQV